MATVSFDRYGNCIIRVVRGKGKHAQRKTIRIGKVSEAEAEKFKRHVDFLNVALITDTPVPRETASFVAERDDKIRDRLKRIRRLLKVQLHSRDDDPTRP